MKSSSLQTLSLILLTTTFTPLDAATSRLIGPNGQCLGVDGPLRASAPVVMANCDDRQEQLWQMPARGFSGPVRIMNDFCLGAESGALQVSPCGQGANSHPWRHDTDGQLVGPGGVCLKAGAPNPSLALCDGGDDQNFLAESHNSWSPAYSGTAKYVNTLYPTNDPAVWYQNGISGLLRSESSARSWAPLNLDGFLAISPNDAQTIWAADETAGVVQRSQDGGRTWLPVLETRAKKIRPSHLDSRRVYISSQGSLWLSLDGGLKFEPRAALPDSEDYPVTIELLESGNGDLFAFQAEVCTLSFCGTGAKVFRSSDRGGSWQEMWSTSADGPFFNLQLLAHPNAPGRLYLKRRDGILRSDDGGATWSESPSLPPEIGRLAIDPNQPDRLYSVGSFRLWRSVDRASTWQELPLPASDFGQLDPSLVVSSDGSLKIYGSTPTMFLESTDDGKTWKAIKTTGFFPTHTQALVASAEPGRFFALSEHETGLSVLSSTDDGGRTWKARALGSFCCSLIADPVAENAFYISNNSFLLKSADAGETFESLELPRNGHFAVARYGSGSALFVLGEAGQLSRSTDGGSSWSDFSIPQVLEPFGQFNSLIVDGNSLYAVTNSSELFRSADGGETWLRRSDAPYWLAAGGGVLAFVENFTQVIKVSVDGGLTWDARRVNQELDFQTNKLWVDKNRTLYLEAKSTLLRSRDLGKTWQALDLDFPLSYVVQSVAVDGGDPNRVKIATDAGIWLGRFDEQPPMALGNGRFAARLTWRDRQGNTGQGFATELTHDTGLFWLFTPERSEVAVKLLDGRQLNGKFWVFVGSLSDVELELEIIDRATNEVWRHQNPQGRLLSLGETQAFPRGEAPLAQAAIPRSEPGFADTSDSVTLDSRFTISVDWRTADGSGRGQGLVLSNDSAAFTFFDRDNVEVLVNVIDGRALNGKFWVFYASLSDVEFTIEVHDTVQETTKVYRSQAGTFASSADTSAF